MARQVPVVTRRVVAISPDDGTVIDLGRPAIAALLSWLVPGLGQILQGRTLKGGLFMGSLMATLVIGLWLGAGRVVYASWRPGDVRLAFLGQAGIGAAAVPALLQALALGGPARQPLGAIPWFAPPLRPGQLVSPAYAARLTRGEPGIEFAGGGAQARCAVDELSLWHARLGRTFDCGTLYTVIAGMLNLLVVFDAWAGPLRERRDDESGKAGDAAPTSPRGPAPRKR